jgi:hypothetical protein
MMRCGVVNDSGHICRASDAVAVEVGCAHEHIYRTGRCAVHRPPGATTYCYYCWKTDRHLCRQLARAAS